MKQISRFLGIFRLTRGSPIRYTARVHMKKKLTPKFFQMSFRLALLTQLFGGLLFLPNLVHAITPSSLLYTFNVNGTLSEAGSMGESTSPYFWLNSGAKLLINNGIGQTVQGSLPSSDYWYKLYAAANPLDTAGGAHPQNLFRLITKSTWGNVTEQVQFKIAKINVDNTPNRGGYSGILLFSRYKNSDNLYYAGIRMDGAAVIKRKAGGVYTTLAQTTVFPGSYDKWSNPNLIPTNVWMGLKTETIDNADGSVTINVYLDRQNNGLWTRILSTRDTSSSAVRGSGSVGIRTDYMDAQFDNYRISTL